MYLFAEELNQPVYYRLINGNVTDIKSMSLCVQEMNIKNIIFNADKGFYSQANIAQLKKEELHYIIPLQRSNSLIDFSSLIKVNFKKELKGYFKYQERIIWYYDYEKEG